MNGAAVIQPSPIPFYTVLVLYLGIMAFIGWYAGRKTNSIGDFFVLSGKAGVLVSGIAYFSTQFSMGTFLGTPGTIYGVGYAGMAISVPGAVFCMILPALLIGRKLITLGHKYGFLTMADYLTDRYERCFGRDDALLPGSDDGRTDYRSRCYCTCIYRTA